MNTNLPAAVAIPPTEIVPAVVEDPPVSTSPSAKVPPVISPNQSTESLLVPGTFSYTTPDTPEPLETVSPFA